VYAFSYVSGPVSENQPSVSCITDRAGVLPSSCTGTAEDDYSTLLLKHANVLQSDSISFEGACHIRSAVSVLYSPSEW
jgi:hypothetical protein